MSNIHPFVHLHVHTEYSMLDGVTRIPDLVTKVKESGMNAVAITDHGVMHGVYEFWSACKDQGVKPIIGCEIYVSPKNKELREDVNGIKYYHLLLLAKDFEGYKNLVKLVSIAQLEGFYYKPRADRELLQKYSKGLICTSACPAGPLGRHIIRSETNQALDWLHFLNETYKDRFYLELQRHGLKVNDELPGDYKTLKEDDKRYLAEQVKINKQLITWSKEFNIPLIATTDSHYNGKDDEITQEILFAIKDGKTLDDPTRRTAYKHTYIKTMEEMNELYSDLPEVLENTQKLADSIEDYNIIYDRIQPQYKEIPKNTTAKDELLRQAFEGAEVKYKKITPEIKARIEYEVELIDMKGYSNYYLVTADYIKWARDHDIVVSMRGSGAASVVAYSLDITSIDPIWWDLMFERFLNPKRSSPPDFDLDLEDQNRDKVIEYISEKYGKDNVAAICTFGRMQTRAAIRDVCRVMKIDLKIADVLSKLVEINFGKPKPIAWMMENHAEFAQIVNADPRLQDMVTIVSKIEGIKRHLSTHACGILITPNPINEYIPVQKEIGGERTITQFDSVWIEYAGLMKFDFLGLANLTIIKNTLNLIDKIYGIKIKTSDIPLDDPKTFELFQKGETTSVFQFESSGIRRFTKELMPTSIKDLCLMAAAYRPGPMSLIPDAIKVKHGQKDPEYLVPELKPILDGTYGAIVYQEQIMKIAVQIAGYESYGDADLLRRSIAKKKKDIMAKEEPIFKGGMLKNGYTQEQADKMWDYLIPFADYGFPKAHSAMYAVVAYWTAYLKAHYPLEFMCARLTSDMNHPNKLIVALDEVKHLKINLLPPDINKSYDKFTPEGKNTIRYGLNGIKNVGHNVVEEIVKDREANGDFKSLDDLCYRVTSANSRTLESLIKVGALNSFGVEAGLLSIYQNVLQNIHKQKQKEQNGQLGFLSVSNNSAGSISSTPIPVANEIPIVEKLKWEKELLGVYFSIHPVQSVISKLEKLNISQLTENKIKENAYAKGACLVSKIKKINTKAGDQMAFLLLEDTFGQIEAVLFPRDYKLVKDSIHEGDVVVVGGKGNLRNGEMNFVINEIRNIDEFTIDNSVLDEKRIEKLKPVKKEVEVVIHNSASQEDLKQLRELLVDNPGNIKVSVRITQNGESKLYAMKNKVDNDTLFTVVKKLPMVEKII